MSHIHNIIDTDSHFYIDAVTRIVTTKADKLFVVQYDHDSERFTFQIPRYVEEHDMTLCDRIEIHYANITRNKREQNNDVYMVKRDDQSNDNDTFFFSWLVSSNATQLVGSLKFSISFICLDEEDNVSYEWSTAMYENIQVLSKLENAAIVRETYPDLYTQMKKEILDSIPPSSGEVDIEAIEQIVIDYLQDNPPSPGQPGEPGKDGDDGYSPTVTVKETETGYKLTITDVNGTYVADIRHGKDGKDGYSPTIDVDEIEGGYTLTITDINGTKTATIRHGSGGDITVEDIKSAVDEYLEENPVGDNHPVVEF